MIFGFCPICGAPGIMRERRPNGNDICENKHTYPSASATKTSDVYLGKWRSKANPHVEVEVVCDYRGQLLVGYINPVNMQERVPQIMQKDLFTNFYERI